MLAIAQDMFGACQTLFKNLYLVGTRRGYRAWLPDSVAISVAWVLGSDSGCTSTVLFGPVTAWWWEMYSPKNLKGSGFASAAGLIAGEGLAGVINVALTLFGVAGDRRGSPIALPGSTR
ncbi:hypothetical protein NLG97_g3625 [Lecanicillium saksenae]|uniref:Uncharacterized protein n=1 Tax=Lecanicillium saksenae TaxID=468837 RepID=A0ACC1QZ00_9HYPO|nr:hypothetical protein NLG97_g3625 [Lecanicillium saksenae]